MGLLCWFVALAIAEAICANGNEAYTSGSNQRWMTNLALTAAIILIGSLLPLAKMTASMFGERFGFGLAHLVAIPWMAVLGLMLLFDSFAAYWVHRLMHAAPLLWRVHRVHHADTLVDVSTSLRNHPLELVVTVPASCCVVLLIGAPASVLAAAQTILVATTIWQHADIRLPERLDRVLAPLIITPRLHRLHHNPERRVHDSNFGDSLTVWDALFGTLNLSRGRGPVGLGEQRAKPDHLLAQMLSPLRPA
jgi:sterol desaturase/sphingolipid hydroxylase (fatty acid hydroxylase superfamily)